VANITVITNSLAVIAYVFTVVTAKTARRPQMPNIVGMGLPIRFHLWKEINLVDSLYLPYGAINGTTLFSIE
jgi:hypothetical protein